MNNWTWQSIVRRSWIGAAILLLGFVVAFEDGDTLTLRSAKAQSAAAPAIRLAATAPTRSPAAGQPRIGGILKFGIVKDIGTPIPFRRLHLHKPIRERQCL